MTTMWWWPAWLGSGASWFVAMNAVVVAIAVLSSCARRSHRAAGATLTRRASSAVLLQSLLSLSIFSFPSACLSSYLQPDAADTTATTDQETEDLDLVVPSPIVIKRSSPSALPLAQVPPPAPGPAPADEGDEEDEDEDEDPNAMTMDEAYALVLASQHRPEREREEEARRSEVDAKADEFIRNFKEDLRQQRLNSIYNYTQMLRRRAPGAGRRPDR